MQDYQYKEIANISPKTIVQYLEKHGWHNWKEVEDVSVLIYNKQGKKFGLFLPLSLDFVDYKNRVSEILITLEEVEERPRWQILDALRSKAEQTTNASKYD
ncbi:MAG: hypothetical protein KME64_17865 [Scytonematopsis contorta HA4267-MV1]|jgi:hypothetical protein|nr:hypothetical protein [Scytonematopsis contorta HA4267-MV1]